MRLLVCLLALALVPAIGAQCREGPGGPKVKRTTSIKYPESAVRLHLQGAIKLQVEVLPDGSPGKVNVVSGFGYGMDEAAVAAVSKWLFSSGCAECTAPVEIDFNLGVPKYQRFKLGPMTFESGAGSSEPVLKTYLEPDVSGSLAPASDGEIEFMVTAEGDPINFRVIREVEPVAERNILQAFAQWKFEPARKDGVLVEARGRFRFHINP